VEAFDGSLRGTKGVNVKRSACLLFLLLSLAVSTYPQKDQSLTAQNNPKAQNADVCKTLDRLGNFVDDAFDEQKRENRPSRVMEKRMLAARLTDPNDSIWDSLIDCSETTKKSAESAEALRVLAMWERLRADAFQKMYLKEVTDRASDSAEASSASATKRSTAEVHPDARELHEAQLAREAKVENERRQAREAAMQSALADSSMISIRAGEQFSNEDLARIDAHNRAICDQVITVGGLTPNGLALYVPPLGQKFMEKNSKNYPRMCLLEDMDTVVPGVRRYLLAYAYSENAFGGFQPVTQVRTSPVSGSGTATNAYGDRWNFTYHGTMTEVDTLQAPYVIQSHSLYLNAYDETGRLVSQRSMTTSSQTGGDAAWSAGYNGAQLIAQLWNNPSHLIKSVLSDVQKDSKK